MSELAQVQAAAAPIIAQAKQISQEYDRALYLYQTVIERIDYEDVADEESAESNRKRSVLGGLIDGKAVCAGYAKTFQYLANASGIRCTYRGGQRLRRNSQRGVAGHGDGAVCTGRIPQRNLALCIILSFVTCGMMRSPSACSSSSCVHFSGLRRMYRGAG